MKRRLQKGRYTHRYTRGKNSQTKGSGEENGNEGAGLREKTGRGEDEGKTSRKGKGRGTQGQDEKKEGEASEGRRR